MRVEFTMEEPYKILPMIDLLIVPNAGDFIDLEDFFHENLFTEEEFKEICTSIWCINSRRWSRDEKGIYVQMFVNGE
jgi:hypothetical protein